MVTCIEAYEIFIVIYGIEKKKELFGEISP